MFNYLIKIEYDGTNFVGWQSQKNGKSIQDTIEKALKKVFNSKIRICGAGRTDKGVHAFSQYAHFKSKKKIYKKKIFIEKLNDKDIKGSYADIQKIQKTIKWTPRCNINYILKDYFNK